MFNAAGKSGKPLVNFGIEGDPYYSKVITLLHGEGANAGTTFTDSSYTPKTYLVSLAVTTATAQFKYGSASIFNPTLNSNGTGSIYTDSSAFAFGTGDFTIEFWARFANTTTSQSVCGIGTSTGVNWSCGINSIGNLRFTDHSTSINHSDNSSLAATTWHHIAFTRQGTTLRMFLNGTLTTSATVATNFTDSSRFYVMAGNQNANKMAGYVDDLRITKGVARYTSSFTAPTAAFPDAVVVTPSVNLSQYGYNTTSSFTLPASVAAGDFVVLYTSAVNQGQDGTYPAYPTAVTPAGFTQIQNIATQFTSSAGVPYSTRRQVFYKKLTVGGSQTYSATASNTGGSNVQSYTVFKPNTGTISAVTVVDNNYAVGVNAETSIVSLTSAATGPGLLWGLGYTSGTTATETNKSPAALVKYYSPTSAFNHYYSSYASGASVPSMTIRESAPTGTFQLATAAIFSFTIA